MIDVVWPLTNPNIVVDVAFKLLIDSVEFVDNEFKFELVPYAVKSGLFIIVLFQSDWKLVGLLSILLYCICNKPEPLPVKTWLLSIVNASVLFVNILILFAEGLYIPLVPLKLIVGIDCDV